MLWYIGLCSPREYETTAQQTWDKQNSRNRRLDRVHRPCFHALARMCVGSE